MSDALKRIAEYMDSEEGKADMKRFAEKLVNQEKILNSQYERAAPYIKRIDELLPKLIKKYNSDKYIQRHYKRGYEPSETLYYFLYGYAEKYGRQSTKEEDRYLANMFTEGIYFIKNWWFMIMHGQGTVIKIGKV